MRWVVERLCLRSEVDCFWSFAMSLVATWQAVSTYVFRFAVFSQSEAAICPASGPLHYR